MARPAGRCFQAAERRRMLAAAAERLAASRRRGGDAPPEIAHASMHPGLAILGDGHATARTSRRSCRGVFRNRFYPQILLKRLFSSVNNLKTGAIRGGRSRPLVALPLVERQAAIGGTNVVAGAFRPDTGKPLPDGVGEPGVTESFGTTAPISLYGATKLASEALAAEYCHALGSPLVIDRCGVMADAGQFGRADQGIFYWWIHSWAAGRRRGGWPISASAAEACRCAIASIRSISPSCCCCG